LFDRLTIRRPANLGNDHRFIRESALQLIIALKNIIQGIVCGYAFPIGQDMGGDKIDFFGQFRVFQPDIPGFRCADGAPGLLFDLTDVLDQLFDGNIFPQQCLIADQGSDDVAVILAAQGNQLINFPLVGIGIVTNPGAQADV